jgi:adenosylcobinamide-phosphate synthase
MPSMFTDAAWFASSPPFLLLLALALEPVLGEARGPLNRLPHPVRLFGWLIVWLDRSLNRPERAERARRLLGVASLLVTAGSAIAIGVAVEAVAAAVPFGWLVSLALLIALLAQRSLYRHVAQVAEALSAGGLAAGREAVARIVGRDVAALDVPGVVRAAIESLAENFSDAVVAPCFWYGLLGLPGILAYKAVNTLDSMIGHLNDRYSAFGWASARLDDALNGLPARLSGAFLALAAAAVPNARPNGAWRTMVRDSGKHRSPNAGWPEAAMAGALGVALAGPRRYGDRIVDDPWLGADGTAAAPADIGRALSIFTVACLINGAAVAGVAALRWTFA